MPAVNATATTQMPPMVAPTSGIRSNSATSTAITTGNGTPSRVAAMSVVVPAMVAITRAPAT